jgi:putative ABC transport system permease protein
MAEQTRRVGLLKSAGATPGFVAAVLLLEHVLVSVLAAAAGIGLGWLLAPLLTKPATGLLGIASAPSIEATTVGIVLATAVAVAAGSTVFPAIRAARTSTARALADGARAPKRHRLTIALSRHLPTPLLIGARLAVRRPRRLLLSIFSIGIAASGIVAVLIVHAVGDSRTVNGHAAFTTIGNPQTIHTDQLTLVLSVMLVVLAAVNAVFVAWSTVIDSRRSSAVSRALGATPEQITTGLSVVQMLPALLGALIGIPGGFAIYDAAKHGGSTTMPPTSWLVLMVACTLVLVAGLTAVSTRLGSRRSVVDVLQSEAA